MPFRHGKNTRVLINEFDLSAYFSEATSNRPVDSADVTPFTSPNKQWIVGQPSGDVGLSGFFDGATGAVDERLNAILGTEAAHLLAILMEGSQIGRFGRVAQFRESAYNVTSPVAGAVAVTASLVTEGLLRAQSLIDLTTAIAATGQQAGQDNSAASSNGGVGQLHIPTNTRNGTVTVKIQHSTDNTTFVDLITFTVVGIGVKTSERIAVGGTVNRYTRVQYTLAGSTGVVNMAVLFSRTP